MKKDRTRDTRFERDWTMPKIYSPPPPSPKKNSFWETIPGTITAIAGLLAAIGALVGALKAAGLIGAKEVPAVAGTASASAPTALTPTPQEKPTAKPPPSILNLQKEIENSCGGTFKFPANESRLGGHDAIVGQYRYTVSVHEFSGDRALSFVRNQLDEPWIRAMEGLINMSAKRCVLNDRVRFKTDTDELVYIITVTH